MLADILTVMWKERKELSRAQGSRSRTLLMMLIPVLTVAILPPLQQRDWLTSAFPLFATFVVPLFTVGTTVPQSFAGEREHHTLATLLASRLPGGAILLGKWALAVAYGWAMTLLVLVASAAVANAARWSGHVVFYKPDMALVHATVGLLMASLIASLGIVLSLHSATAQSAQQTLMAAIMTPAVLLVNVPILLMTVVPGGPHMLDRVLSIDLRLFVIVTVAVLVMLNVALLLAALAGSRRERLISC